MNALLSQFEALLGPINVLIDEDAAPYLTDWRKLRTGRALAVLRPADTQEVAGIVRICAEAGVAMVPQGGNTGQVAGATPDESGRAVVVLLQRLNRIREIDTENDTITVEAGCILEAVQEKAQAAGRLFPLSLGAEGSCEIGGNLATNAGGTQVLRYGNARELTLGLEVVTPQGEIWEGLRGLRKDNAGYDLRDIYIGSEGTLGIITAATLKLFPLPAAKHTAFLALRDLTNAAGVLNNLRKSIGDTLCAFEIMSRTSLDLVLDRFSEQRLPFGDLPDEVTWFALIEVADGNSEDVGVERFSTLLADVLENTEIVDAVIATSEAQRDKLWQLRESITLAISETGYCVKHDVSLPVSKMTAFVGETNVAIALTYPGSRPIVFGHLGDGNLHYNLLGPEGANREEVIAMAPAVQRVVYDRVAKARGSISAEQGIGWSRIDDLAHYLTPVEIDLMSRIKTAFDPGNIMNPGKILREPS